jgi:hypothetical protein
LLAKYGEGAQAARASLREAIPPMVNQIWREARLELAEARLLLFSHLGSSIPFPFLAVLLLWITILFAGFSLMAPPSPVTLASLVVCALSVSAAIFLILGLDEPFFGLMAIQSEPLKNALPPLNV